MVMATLERTKSYAPHRRHHHRVRGFKVVNPWSPHLYRSQGLEEGRDEVTLNNALIQADRPLALSGAPPILTLGHLSHHVRVPYKYLRSIVLRKIDPYTAFQIRKRSGGARHICVPSCDLMRIQRWTDRHILPKQKTSPYSFAYEHGSRAIDCARVHCGCAWLIRMDVHRFFESISERRVYSVFLSFGYEPLVAFQLARICTRVYSHNSPRYRRKHWTNRGRSARCFGDPRVGHLPQGAPTSPRLSNLVMKPLDRELVALAGDLGVAYSRYADDLYFSAGREFGRAQAHTAIRSISKLLRRHGLRPHAGKTLVMTPASRRVALGLLVNGAAPRLSREFKSGLRLHLYFLETHGPEAHRKARGFESIVALRRHLLGKAEYARTVEPAFGQDVRERLRGVEWPT